MEAGRRVDPAGLNPALQPLFGPQVQGFVMSAMALDPAELIAKADLPVLIVQGTRDLQVSAADAQRLAKAQPRAQLALLPDTNHVLKSVATDDRTANLATYANPSMPLAPGVADAIARFVKAPAP